MNILDAYISTAPSAQNAIDIFKGEWSSKFPASTGLVSSPGHANLFEDGRIRWLSQMVGGFTGKNVLELGPLEAGHTFMVHAGGAAAVTAIEANSRSYLKCLCVKEAMKLDRARFLYGDAVQYMQTCEQKFDVCIASGILYHSNKPVEFLHDIGRVSDTVFIWTHYYEPEALSKLGEQFKQFDKPADVNVNGKTYTLVKRNYAEALNWAGFSGGGDTSAKWLTRDSLMRVIEDAGFKVEAVNFDQPNHQNGPALALVARRIKV